MVYYMLCLVNKIITFLGHNLTLFLQEFMLMLHVRVGTTSLHGTTSWISKEFRQQKVIPTFLWYKGMPCMVFVINVYINFTGREL